VIAFSRAAEASRPLSTPSKLRLVGEILLTYARVRWSMMRRGVPATVSELRACGAVPAEDDHDHVGVNGWRLGRAVTRTLRLLPTDSRCLVRSLVLTGLLARRGIRSSLVIGVRTDQDFEAHAWVEYAGRPVLPDDGFSPLTQL
jgi:hypothetical protein